MRRADYVVATDAADGRHMVTITVQLPADVAARALELERERPGRIARMLRIEIARREIYARRHQRILAEQEDQERRVLRENGALPSGGAL